MENYKENSEKPKFLNKSLLEATLMEEGSELYNSKHLQPFSQNQRDALETSNVKIVNTMTTSCPINVSLQKKQTQCAQQ